MCWVWLGELTFSLAVHVVLGFGFVSQTVSITRPFDCHYTGPVQRGGLTFLPCSACPVSWLGVGLKFVQDKDRIPEVD